MANFTKKWQNDFVKKYSKTLKSLQELENEFSQMVKENPDDSWELNMMYVENDTVNFEAKGSPSIFYNQSGEESEENVEVQFSTTLGYFYFKMNDFNSLIKFRNDLIDAIDKFNRPSLKKEIITDDCQEDQEESDNNEESEYTIQASRTCVQSWTHTVLAKSACEAYKKVKEDEDGTTHDENDSYDNYGDIDYEIV